MFSTMEWGVGPKGLGTGTGEDTEMSFFDFGAGATGVLAEEGFPVFLVSGAEDFTAANWSPVIWVAEPLTPETLLVAFATGFLTDGGIA
jgi:hypothetical protein